jgi:hypothetical protein
MNSAILHQPWGGLGDNLQFSTLPRRLHDEGIEFYVSSANAYRNNEIKKIVWDANPYVLDSDYDAKPNCGALSPRDISYNCRNIIEWNEARFNFKPKNSIPEIFYKPNLIDNLEDKIVIDIGAISSFSHNKYDLKNLKHNLKIVIDTYEKDKIYIIESEHSPSPFALAESIKNLITKNIKVENIFHYSDVIMSCEVFICLYSGSNVLSAAIRKNNTICYVPDSYSGDDEKIYSYVNSPKCWFFPNNTYILSDGRKLNDMPWWRF